jgi:hypothetical protein
MEKHTNTVVDLLLTEVNYQNSLENPIYSILKNVKTFSPTFSIFRNTPFFLESNGRASRRELL